MKMCQAHWDGLKQAIKVRGLSDFVAASGEELQKRMEADLQGGKIMRKNFDPLMGAHNQIYSNAFQVLNNIGADPLVLLNSDSETDPHLACPICYLNHLSEEHDKVCSEPNCKKPKGLRFDDWIDKAADGAMETLKSLKE